MPNLIIPSIVVLSLIGIGMVIFGIFLIKYFNRKSQRKALSLSKFSYESFAENEIQPDRNIYYDTISVLFTVVIDNLPVDVNLYPLEFSLVFKKDKQQHILTKDIGRSVNRSSELLFALDDNNDARIKDLSSILASPGTWDIVLLSELYSKILYKGTINVVDCKAVIDDLQCVSNLVVSVDDNDYKTSNILCSTKSIIPAFTITSKYPPSKLSCCNMQLSLVNDSVVCDEIPVEVKFNKSNSMQISYLYEREFSEGMWYFKLHINDRLLHQLPFYVFNDEQKTKITTTVCGSPDEKNEVVLVDDMHLSCSKFIHIKVECICANPMPWVNHKIGIVVRIKGDHSEENYEAETCLSFINEIITVKFRPFKLTKECSNSKSLYIDVTTLKDDIICDNRSIDLKLNRIYSDVQGRLTDDELELNADLEYSRILEEASMIK